MNNYLKEIAALCCINKHLTTHVARYSFASSVALPNKVSLSNVAKMMGHTTTRMTHHYAKVMDSSIMQDMEMVESNFSCYKCSHKKLSYVSGILHKNNYLCLYNILNTCIMTKLKPGPKPIAKTTGEVDKRRRDNKETPGNNPKLKPKGTK